MKCKEKKEKRTTNAKMASEMCRRTVIQLYSEYYADCKTRRHA